MSSSAPVSASVSAVDRELCAVDDAFDFLRFITPINLEQAWQVFERSAYRETPEFRYRALPIDPLDLRSRLSQLPFSRIDDPLLARIFSDKRRELEIKLDMLTKLETPAFCTLGCDLYGRPSASLRELSAKILDQVPQADAADSVSPEEFADRAESECAAYRRLDASFLASVEIDETSSGLVAAKGHLRVGRYASIARNRVDALIAHEVGTHLICYYNGALQPLQLFKSGLASYEELQEALAVTSEYLSDGIDSHRLRQLAARALAACHLCDGADFVQCFSLLSRAKLEARVAFGVTARVYRGGGFVKDMIYVRGLVKLLELFAQGLELGSLFSGKFAFAELPVLEELQARAILRQPALEPRHLRKAETQPKRNKLEAGLSVFELGGSDLPQTEDSELPESNRS